MMQTRTLLKIAIIAIAALIVVLSAYLILTGVKAGGPDLRFTRHIAKLWAGTKGGQQPRSWRIQGCRPEHEPRLMSIQNTTPLPVGAQGGSATDAMSLRPAYVTP